jgi:L-asparagine transporter-like permease
VGYIYVFILLGLLFIVLHYFTELGFWPKVAAIVFLGGIGVFAYFYNQYSAQQQRKISNNVQAFTIGKTLRCNDKEINSTNYTLSIGTYTFIGKENTPYYGEMVSVSSCR